jgi:very-short-patch-repair endonuclease
MNEQEIISMYRDQSKSTYEIAEHFKTYPNKIRRILIKHGVDIKDKSAAQKNAIKNGKATIPTQGKARSKEEKLKISKSLQKRWQNMTEEEYKKHVDRAKKRWSNMSKAEKLKMSELAIKAIQKAGKDGSKLEKFLREEISRHGYTVQAHKKNLIPNENLEIDMYFPELKAIIEVDGPSHFLPIWGEEKLRKQIKADSHKTGLILSKGFAIIRVKSLHDSVSLHSKEELKNKLINILDNFSKHFPSKSKRYLEIEV